MREHVDLGMEEGNGGLAQLGERVLCKHQVSGSIPLFSTRSRGQGRGRAYDDEGP